ncbi:MAG: GntR family transcriptional regulator [Gammaproteobacteria bacterium]|jgi:DNA-binding GntR family transcriptional regulator|nr:GntR family transcriptional regulator [Gammaproteobacteria bacterium]
MNQSQLLKIEKVPASLRQQVLEQLREAIITGLFLPGARLIERELTDQMGVSRTVVREALRQLEAEHLVEVIPNKGPFVRQLSCNEAEDLYRIRAVLHGLAARMCAENISKKNLVELEEALELVVEAYKKSSERTLKAKTHFYNALYKGTQSDSLKAMLETLQARIARWRALGLAHPNRSQERSKESIINLRTIIDSVKRKDADQAESVMFMEDIQAGREVTRLLNVQQKEQKTN